MDRLTNTRALRRRPGVHVDVAVNLDGEEHRVDSLRKTVSLAIREGVVLVEPDGLLEKRKEGVRLQKKRKEIKGDVHYFGRGGLCPAGTTVFPTL